MKKTVFFLFLVFISGNIWPETAGLNLSIVPFTDKAGIETSIWLSSSIGEGLTLRLSGINDLRLVERNRLNGVLNELRLQLSGLVDADDAAGHFGMQLVPGSDTRDRLELQGLVDKAAQDISRNRLQQALDDLDRALELRADSPALRLQHGVGLREALHDYAGAVDDFAAGLRLDPLNAALHNEKAYTEFWMGNDDDAVEDIEKAVSLEPDSS